MGSMPRLDPAPVDTPRERSVSFAPPKSSTIEPGSPGRGAITIGPSRPIAATAKFVPGGERDQVTGYPVQPTKVQRPPLRDETLARNRLLEWLDVKIHHRVVFVTAEAGYGKTTLLADFSRRTRVRTLWYRLDAEDDSWIAFLSYLVAAGRQHDPNFAPKTFGLLGEVGLTGPSRDSVVATFIREFQSLGDQGAALILDDYHAVDDSTEIREILRDLLARAPERVTFVFSSRRTPSVRVARLRALGEVAELTTDDLRFNDTETERLFRETYGQPLEPDVLDDLSHRTDGWAASLQLVQAAIRHRDAGEIRRFVRSISGAEGALYDYLAEEVIGDLPDDLQEFLMRTALLESIDESLAALPTGLTREETSFRILQLENAGLLGRRGDAARSLLRFHPLVREFLQQRLLRSVGVDEVRRIHLRIAHGAVGEWKLAAHHFAEANEPTSVHEALQAATLHIMGGGDYELAASYSKRFPLAIRTPKYDVVQSRVDFRRGDLAGAVTRARAAYAEAPESDDVLANLVAFEVMVGDLATALDLATRLEQRTDDPDLAGIASATVALLKASLDLDLQSALARLDALAEQQRSAGHPHYEGISALNSAVIARAMGDADGALSRSSRAIELLEASSAGWEVAGAQMNRGWALIHLGRSEEGSAELAKALGTGHAMARAEALIDAALIEAFYGSLKDSAGFLQEASPLLGTAPHLLQEWLLASAHHAIRVGAISEAASLVKRLNLGRLAPTPGQHLHQLVVVAHLAILTGADEDALSRGMELAAHQHSLLFGQYLSLLVSSRSESETWDRAVARALKSSPAHTTILAELVAERLHDLSAETFDTLRKEAERRPLRWQSALRMTLDRLGPSTLRAARMLDQVGAPEDIRRLRSVAKSLKADGQLGKRLARRLAPRVVVEDQGRVAILIGSRLVAGTDVRRKVLAALCFLLSRPDFSATRDQILDALWPDLDPDVALNSLNQTVYFLRRVFEPEYKEEVSPEYLHHDSDVLWLDRGLVSARSADCLALVRAASSEPTPELLSRLSDTYQAKFALDFAYEDWAAAYRDGLHASYLQLIEAAVTADMASGHFDRAIRLARRALEVDAEAEELELSLLRLYRQTGAHSAAAEQYAHYAAAIRSELGVEPPPLETI
jgi:ATP/maltotriose-dependent transcriptional regulator MalT/DNA-binding SARP family transcriptional activator